LFLLLPSLGLQFLNAWFGNPFVRAGSGSWTSPPACRAFGLFEGCVSIQWPNCDIGSDDPSAPSPGTVRIVLDLRMARWPRGAHQRRSNIFSSPVPADFLCSRRSPLHCDERAFRLPPYPPCRSKESFFPGRNSLRIDPSYMVGSVRASTPPSPVPACLRRLTVVLFFVFLSFSYLTALWKTKHPRAPSGFISRREKMTLSLFRIPGRACPVLRW